MKINRKNAMRFWEEEFGDVRFAEDFHGNLMCKDGYGDPDYYVYDTDWSFAGQRSKIYCGWNIHHILPLEQLNLLQESNRQFFFLHW